MEKQRMPCMISLFLIVSSFLLGIQFSTFTEKVFGNIGWKRNESTNTPGGSTVVGCSQLKIQHHFTESPSITPKFSSNLNSTDVATGMWKIAAIWRGPMDWPPIPERKTNGWEGEYGQDQTVAQIFDFKRNGYFIDFAANDYVMYSNTVHLERKYSWNGLCIEPQDKYFDNHLKFRKCTTVKAVVTNKSNDVVQFNVRRDGHCPGCSGIIGESYDNKRIAKDAEMVRFTTLDVKDLFASFNVPSVVDFLSLDIEGAEYITMRSFPFDKYKFMLMTVERPKELHAVLLHNGYHYLKEHGRHGDKMYIHDSFPNRKEVQARFGK